MTDELTLKPGAFDLDAFVSGAVVAKDSVEVSSKPGLQARLVALMSEHHTQSKAEPTRSKRLAEKDGADLADLEEQIRAMAEEMEGSWIEVEFTTPTPTQRREASEIGKEVNEATVAALLERVGRLRPKGGDDDSWATLDQSGWARIFDAIGADQFGKIADSLALLAYGKGVTPGFSRRALSYLETRASSKS